MKMLLKGEPTEDAEGFLTERGIAVATEYARAWVVEGARYLKLERDHPELGGTFFDIRTDSELAHRYAEDETPVQKAGVPEFVLVG